MAKLNDVTANEDMAASKVSRKSVQNVATNITSMLSSNVTIRATNFVMYALMARYLGVYQFGQISLATTLFFSVVRIALVGLQTYLIREVARNREQTGLYFFNASAIVTVTSLLSMLFMFGLALALRYSRETTFVIMLLFVGMVPYTLSQIAEGLFQAWEKMYLIAYANVPLNILQLGVAIILLARGYDITAIVITMIALFVAILLVEWFFVFRYIAKPTFRLDIPFSKTMLKGSMPFLGIQATNAFKSSITVLLISKLLNETDVGIYSAANQLLTPLQMIFNNVVSSVFPLMVRKFESGVNSLRRVTEYIIEFLLAITLPAVVGIFVIAPLLLVFIYKDPAFLRAVPVLRILVWLPLSDAMTTTLGQALWASKHEKISLRISVTNLILNLIFGYILINRFGLIGAAISTTLVVILSLIQYYVPTSKKLNGIRLPMVIWRSGTAAAVMAAFIFLSRIKNIYLLIPFAAFVYGAVLAVLIVWSNGGLHEFILKYQHLWVKSNKLTEG